MLLANGFMGEERQGARQQFGFSQQSAGIHADKMGGRVAEGTARRNKNQMAGSGFPSKVAGDIDEILKTATGFGQSQTNIFVQRVSRGHRAEKQKPNGRQRFPKQSRWRY